MIWKPRKKDRQRQHRWSERQSSLDKLIAGHQPTVDPEPEQDGSGRLRDARGRLHDERGRYLPAPDERENDDGQQHD